MCNTNFIKLFTFAPFISSAYRIVANKPDQRVYKQVCEFFVVQLGFFFVFFRVIISRLCLHEMKATVLIEIKVQQHRE